MKLLLSLVLAVLVFCPGCATPLTPQQSAIATTASNLARIAVEAGASYFGGAGAADLASKGLDGLAAVIQGYVGAKIPAAIVKASPGVTGVGAALVKQIAPNHVVSQEDVDKVAAAARIAATLAPALVLPESP